MQDEIFSNNEKMVSILDPHMKKFYIWLMLDDLLCNYMAIEEEKVNCYPNHEKSRLISNQPCHFSQK